MTEIRLDQLELPTAEVGEPNPLPPLFAGGNADKTADLAAAPPDMREAAGYGRVDSICPYLMQDGYRRERRMRRHPVAVLENEQLRATFLLDAGARMWSLVHVPTNAELLFANPIFQPANLALRSAWLAGGVEWNIGTIGHTPLTCEPMHAARVTAPDGSPVLRLYEFERLRRVVYQLDVHLPPGSPVLYVHVRITNPNEEPVPMYWWSNMAVPQRPDTRVLVPADRAWTYSYDNVVRHEPVVGDGNGDGDGETDGSGDGDRDVSYPARFSDAADFFFDLGGSAQPWIAAVQGAGSGVFQTSTRELVGRKLFRWGTGPGGRRWQRWLSGRAQDGSDGYAEIQAGLARTQFEHLPMPAGAIWSWTEGYGRLDLDAADASAGWPRARAAAQRAVADAVPAKRLARQHDAAGALADRPPDALLHTGSGWAALDRRIRGRAGEPALDRPGTPFPDGTLGPDQQPWLDVLQDRPMPDLAPGEFPASVHLHPLFTDLLAPTPGWTAPALRGVIRARQGELDGAHHDWQLSISRTDNAYARRNLGLLARHRGDPAAGAEHYRRALALAPQSACLVVEALDALIAAGRPAEALALIDASPAMREHGRIRLMEATAALAAGELHRCGQILGDPAFEVPDLREGEDSLDQLWWDYQSRCIAAERGIEPDDALRAEVRRTVTVPEHLDFRMHADQA